jgi:hypothetical protein
MINDADTKTDETATAPAPESPLAAVWASLTAPGESDSATPVLNAGNDADAATLETAVTDPKLAAEHKAETVTGPGRVTPASSQKNGKAKVSPNAGALNPKAATNGKHDGVTQAGAVKIENEAVLRAVPLFYYADKGHWYCADGRGRYTKMSEAQAKAYVAMYGYNKSVKDCDGNSKADRAMIWLMQNKRVAFAGLLAGYPAGVHESAGVCFLVTESPAVIMPKPGNCETIHQLIGSLLFEEDRKQIVYFHIWASESFKAFYGRIAKAETDNFRHCPALAIFGPRGCGKTALIDLVLAPLLGVRKADPMNYLSEDNAKFNKDLFAASLLGLDDKGASANLADRRKRGEGIKDLIWKPDQRIEGKNCDVLYLRPFWRLVIAGNDDDGGLQVCPALSPSLEDKLLIMRAAQAEGLPTTHEENDAWAKQIRTELPAFADFLLKYRVPENVDLDPRTRIPRFWNPKIVTALRELQPEMRLLELIDTLGLIEPPKQLWEGRATEFQNAMMKLDVHGLLGRIFVSDTAAGRMLTELWRMVPNRVLRTDRDNQSYYRIYPPVPRKEN